MSPEIFIRPLDIPCGERQVMAFKVNLFCSLNSSWFETSKHLPRAQELVNLFDSKLHTSGKMEDLMTVGNFVVKKMHENGNGVLRFIHIDNFNYYPDPPEPFSVPDTRIIYKKDTREITRIDRVSYLGLKETFYGVTKIERNMRIWSSEK